MVCSSGESGEGPGLELDLRRPNEIEATGLVSEGTSTSVGTGQV